jgi:cytochrome b561
MLTKIQIVSILIVVDESQPHRYDAPLIDERPKERHVNPMRRAALPDETQAGERARAEDVDAHDAHPSAGNAAPDRYDSVARFFHWIFAAAIIYASIAGYSLTRIPHGPVRDALSQLNMSIGTVLIALFPFRAGWKLCRSEPRALPGVSARQQSLARVVHRALYGLIFVVLASGFLMVPNGYTFFGMLRIHTPFHPGWLTDDLFAVHRASCALLAGGVILHVLAVVKHQVFARRAVLSRML